MSDPAKSEQIEDVLSSIRRLVSDGHPASDGSVMPVQSSDEAPDPNGKLVLTPSFRVTDPDDPWRPIEAREERPSAEDQAPADPKADWEEPWVGDDGGQEADARDNGAVSEESAQDRTIDEATDHDKDDTDTPFEDQLVYGEGSMEAFEPEHGDMNWPDESSAEVAMDVAALRMTRDVIDDLSSEPQTSAEDPAPEEEPPWPGSPPAEMGGDQGEDDGGYDGDGDPAEAMSEDNDPDETPAEAWAASVDETDSSSDDEASQDEVSEAHAEDVSEAPVTAEAEDTSGEDRTEIDEASTDDTDDGAGDDEPPAFFSRASTDRVAELGAELGQTDGDDALEDDVEDLGDDSGLFAFPDDDEAVIDEELLREIVSDIVREELQGVLGQRLTRNVRKLVRREIRLALAAEELD